MLRIMDTSATLKVLLQQVEFFKFRCFLNFEKDQLSAEGWAGCRTFTQNCWSSSCSRMKSCDWMFLTEMCLGEWFSFVLMFQT